MTDLVTILNINQEEQFLHAQKLEALALLAGGVIHDFNNLLTTILRHAELVSRRFAAADPNKPNTAILTKPFSPGYLARKVREALDS